MQIHAERSVVLIRIKMVNYYLVRSRHSCRFLVTFPRGPVLVRCVISKSHVYFVFLDRHVIF